MNSSKFFKMVKQMSSDHSEWIKKQQYTISVEDELPIPVIYEEPSREEPGLTKWVSPKASSTPMIDLFANSSGRKGDGMRSLVVPATSTGKKRAPRKAKMPNEFFL